MTNEEKYNEFTKQIIDIVNCPYEVFPAKKTINQIMKAYFGALKEGKKEGYTPLIVVPSDTLAETIKSNVEDGFTAENLLQKTDLDAKEIFDNYINYYQAGFDDRSFLGEKKYGEKINQFCSLRDETILFKIPTKNPWEVIAWVPMGGWNECPSVDDMLAINKYWYEKHGAIPAVVSSDTVEYMLDKPVKDEDEAWELAKEHCLFCSDRVFQGTESETIGELADCISKSTVWFFWWD